MQYVLNDGEKELLSESGGYFKSRFNVVGGKLKITTQRVLFVKESKMIYAIFGVLIVAFQFMALIAGVKGVLGLIFLGLVVPIAIAMLLRAKLSMLQGKVIVNQKALNEINSISIESHGMNNKQIVKTNSGEFVSTISNKDTLNLYESEINAHTKSEAIVEGNVLKVNRN